MNIGIIGAAGFIGTNLIIKLSQNSLNNIVAIDSEEKFFNKIKSLKIKNVTYKISKFALDSDFDIQIKGLDVIYHLSSTIIPSSNNIVSEDIVNNAAVTAQLLDACVRQNIKRVIFISSGGTVYGKKGTYPIREEMVTYPINSYGLQKVFIEKLLYLYRYQKGLDYRIIRLSNPYGPYQRPNNSLGVITNFIYHAINGKTLNVYGDGTVVRDYIYISDAVEGIVKIAEGESEFRTYNLGSGKGTSINDIINSIRQVLNINIDVKYVTGRKNDVPINILDISRYERTFGELNLISLKEGIKKSAEFLRTY